MANWPELPLDRWRDTYETLHLYTQIVGKHALALAPRMNHWWQTALRVSPRGLVTRPLPYGARTFDLTFDFIEHRLVVQTSAGESRSLSLVPRTVADFYREVKQLLMELGLSVHIWPVPVELADPIPFEEDRTHASYDPEAVGRFFAVLRQVAQVFDAFRGRFAGKASAVNFWWGSFDLAVSRFSGRWLAPRPNADSITLEAYNQEVSSLGFWPGGGAVPGAAFYSYVVPEPSGFSQQAVRPEAAFYSDKLHEFLLMYDDVRSAPDPAETLLEFAQSTYEAAARLGDWDREELEYPRHPHRPPAAGEGPEPAIPSPT